MRLFHIFVAGQCVLGIYAVATQQAGKIFLASDVACTFPIGTPFKVVEVAKAAAMPTHGFDAGFPHGE